MGTCILYYWHVYYIIGLKVNMETSIWQGCVNSGLSGKKAPVDVESVLRKMGIGTVLAFFLAVITAGECSSTRFVR